MDNQEVIIARKPLSIRRIADSRKNIVVFYMLIAVLFCTMILAYVWSFVKMVEIKVGLNKISTEYKDILKEHDKLLAERAKLSATNRIEEMAKGKLMMTLPTRVEYVSLLQNYYGATNENALKTQ